MPWLGFAASSCLVGGSFYSISHKDGTMTDTETYQILALKYAERHGRTRADSFIFDDDHAAPHPIDYFIWVISNENRTIIVDTGYDRAEGIRRGRHVLIEPHRVLDQLDINAGTIEDVVITHLHYDHAGTLHHFPKARFHLQEAEMTYATGPCMCHDTLQMPYTAEHVCEMVRHVYSGRVEFYDGDSAMAPGISLHKIGGHSRGLQAVRVITERGPVVLASDASHYYENVESKKPFPIVVDAEAMLSGFDRLLELSGNTTDRIIPGHDPLVLSRYPAWSSQTQGVVHRLDISPLS